MGLRCHQVVAKFRSLDPQDSARSYGTAHDATHYFRVLHNDYVSGSKVPVLRSQLTETFHEALIEKTAVGLNPSNLVIPPAEPRGDDNIFPKKNIPPLVRTGSENVQEDPWQWYGSGVARRLGDMWPGRV